MKISKYFILAFINEHLGSAVHPVYVLFPFMNASSLQYTAPYVTMNSVEQSTS